MQEFRKSTAETCFVFLVDASNNPKTGIVATDVAGASVQFTRSNGSQSYVSLSGGNWTELDATENAGVYRFAITATETGTVGMGSFGIRPAASAFVKTQGLYLVRVDLGTPAGASVSADIAAIKTETANIYARQGAPAGASQSADTAAIKSETANIYARQGAPAGASQSADVAALNTKLGTPAGASISADIAAVAAGGGDLDSIENKLDQIQTTQELELLR